MPLTFLLAMTIFNPVTELATVQETLNEQLPGYVWSCKEIGDGNINYIYLADAGDKKILVKKALDFARINPEEFPLPVERLLYEYRAFTFYEKFAPEHIPQIYFFDLDRGMLAMEYLTPHIILRRGLIQGQQYPQLANHLGTFMARVLYFTSCYHLSEQEWKHNVSLFANNTAMRKIILDLNYTDPFYGSSLNWWTSPELDDTVAEIQNDAKIKIVVNQLKDKFLNFPEALAHGDLHTGSVLVTPTDTRVFDTEFATYAPISFDIGMLLSNFTIASFASKGYGTDGTWLAELTRSTWDTFEIKFRELWENETVSVDDKLKEVWSDSLRLMGMEIIRRTMGVAHNADFENIADREVKVDIERKALQFAKELLLDAEASFPDSKTLENRINEARV